MKTQLLETERAFLLRRGVALAAATVAWNIVEGVVAVSAGALASSVALIGFGIDSFVETASAAVVGWRLRAELKGHADEERAEALEHRAARMAGALLLGLAVYITIDAGRRLLGFGAEARESGVGIVLTAVSLVLMPLLGRAKLRTAAALQSGALRADAYETIACAWLSLATLGGAGTQRAPRLVVGGPSRRACHRPARRTRGPGELAGRGRRRHGLTTGATGSRRLRARKLSAPTPA